MTLADSRRVRECGRHVSHISIHDSKNPTWVLYVVLYGPLYTGRIKPYHTDEAKDAKDSLLHHAQHLVPAMNDHRWQHLDR